MIKPYNRVRFFPQKSHFIERKGEEMEILLYIVVAILSALGLIELMKMLTNILFSAKDIRQKVVVYPVSGAYQDLEMSIRALYHRARWDTNDCNNEIYLLDLGMDEESKRIAKVLSQDLSGLHYCDQQTLVPEILQNQICNERKNEL